MREERYVGWHSKHENKRWESKVGKQNKNKKNKINERLKSNKRSSRPIA